MIERERTEFIFVHCSATPPNRLVSADNIDQWHRARGWSGIGYHRVIRRSGSIELGRPIEMSGAHVRGLNRVSVGVCLIGGVNQAGEPEPNYTAAQFKTLRDELKLLSLAYSGAKILGHCDAPDVAKACPCFDVRHWLTTGEITT